MNDEIQGGTVTVEGADSKAEKPTETTVQTETTPDIDKLVQARADKLTAELGKKNAALQKELDKIKKAQMTAEEVRALEMSEKEKALAEREKMLQDRENRLLAIKAIKAAGLDDGSDSALEIVEFVMADSEEAINGRVKAFGDLVKKLVASEVDKTFKKHGRNPDSAGDGSGTAAQSTVAEQLGKARAAKQKQSNDILNYYLGGNA